jgi:SAM-dependent methyltransferase
MAKLMGRPNLWQAWGDLLHTVQTGDTAFNHVHGCNVWDYRARSPVEADIFDRAMASGTEQFAQAILDVCDFGRFKHVVDIGGGDGMFLAKILERHPDVRGTLFDQPHVLARAAPSAEPFGGRYRAIGGNFFNGVPDEGDAYLLKWILHDWSDSASVDILKSCRRAMKRSGRLLVAEYVIGFDNASADAEFMDLTMMVMNGGRERTRDEFSSIFMAAGFRLESVTATATPLCLIEGTTESE